MKILWICNGLHFPDICRELNLQEPVTGGWMKSLMEALLSEYSDLEIGIAALYDKTNILIEKKINKVTYFCLPFKNLQSSYGPELGKCWKNIDANFKPDVVHIHGTEFPFGLEYIKSCGAQNVVASIQGLISVIARYSLGNIPISELKKCQTLYGVIKEHLLNTPKNMLKSGMTVEAEYMKVLNHVIGRTSWDRDHVWALNSNLQYHFGNECLRNSFYELKNRWSLENCEKHTIFLSQAQKPIKGLHKMIEAMPYVLRDYPDTKVYIAGYDFINTKTIKEKIKFSTYANYILYLLKKFKIRKHFIFTGPLNEQEMVQRYQKSHIFVCPSSIENSPNSLGEAQILGLPCIASYVGGIPDMIVDGVTGFMYRFEEHEMLAKHICNIFSKDHIAQKISENAQQVAYIRHNRTLNAKKTYDIYLQIIEELNKDSTQK